MSATCFRTFVFVLLLPSAVAAHRLDEYLQAARLAVSSNGVSVELDLTPGASVARGIAARIDRDADGAIAPAEAEAYGRAVLADLELSVNGRGVPMTLTRVESPAIDEMSDGVGTIRLEARADLAAAPASRMVVRFANHHASRESVYLVNALKPTDRRIVLERQSRDVRQQSIDLDYAIQPGHAGAIGWSFLAISLVFGLVRLRA
jgi:hypothetical protein